MIKRPAAPVTRSGIRMAIGKLAYTWLRRCTWLINNSKYASVLNTEVKFPYLYADHNTPILRELSGINMQLQHNKITNLSLACAKLNGILVNPGETISFWKLVGKPSRRKGYLEGMVLVNGSICSGIGGGLCQLSNLIYWMTIHTPLTVTERWRHNYDVFPDSNRDQPFGSGATVSYNYIDLQIKNNTQERFQLFVWVGDGKLFGEWRTVSMPQYSYEVYEREHSINHEWWGGYVRHNVLHRKVHNLNINEVSDEYIVDNHAIMMYEPLLPQGQLDGDK
jgi:vancomycin resistance protein VanW